ncbi:hypothetical protein R3X26_05460 [Vibrio sp. TH_r3]|uniref:hypothetical protein n=1 Tax=Vibrio sp. TH_r3 TaxID=3082084 RepID=UPI0029542F36|nr:hypothetical protein [Vibrio sp. TH_r3]MDV7103856.1 hypothetical protein [Vibrio sp. TH_r3]
MSLIQRYTELFKEFSHQQENWDFTSDSPFTLTRKESDQQLPLSLFLQGNEETVHIFFSLYNSTTLTKLAKDWLKTQGEEKFVRKDEDSGLIIYIDHEGFAAVLETSDSTPEDVIASIDQSIKKAELLLIKSVESVQKASESSSSAEESTDSETETTVVQEMDVSQVVESYLVENSYKHKHLNDRKRFVFGFSTKKYKDSDGDNSVQIVIDYSDDDLLRFTTPWLYKFDLDKTDYSLIASAIVWYQFTYKFLSMSLDPSDGELTICIDIPLGDGAKVCHKQIDRLVKFIHQVTEVTYDEIFGQMLEDSQGAESKLKSKIESHKKKRTNARWFESVKGKLDELSEQQKRQIEEILNNGDDEDKRAGI